MARQIAQFILDAITFILNTILITLIVYAVFAILELLFVNDFKVSIEYITYAVAFIRLMQTFDGIGISVNLNEWTDKDE